MLYLYIFIYIYIYTYTYTCIYIYTHQAQELAIAAKADACVVGSNDQKSNFHLHYSIKTIIKLIENLMYITPSK